MIVLTKGHKRKSHEHRADLAGEYKWGDTGQIVLLVFFIVGMVADVVFLHSSGDLPEIVPWYVRLIGFIPGCLAAGYFIHKSHKKVFGEHRDTLSVIDTGIYSRLRHPMYFGSVLLYLSFVFVSLSVLAMSIFLVVLIFYYYLCRYEEKVLVEQLGDQYRQYMSNVPMLIPQLRT